MKKQLLLGAMLMGAFFTTNAQTTLFEDGFEDYTDFAIEGVGEWTLIDVDGLATYGFTGSTFENSGEPMAFIVFNAETTTPPLEADESNDFTAYMGSKAMASFAAVPDNATDGNNDWLISPQITLAESGNMLSFWAKSGTAQYGEEEFTVAISTTDTDPASFTVISDGTLEAPGVTYEEFTFDLDDYSGQPVYIAINNVGYDHFVFMVDDFKVTADGPAGVNDVLASKFSVFPNPANDVINITNAENILVSGVSIADTNGRTVKSAQFSGVKNASVNVSDLASGVYMMTVSSDEGTMTKKIVKN